jgi:plasmid stability protein
VGEIQISDLDDAVVAALEARAAARGHSLEAELHELLTRAAGQRRTVIAEELAAIRAMTPKGPRRLAENLVAESRRQR